LLTNVHITGGPHIATGESGASTSPQEVTQVTPEEKWTEKNEFINHQQPLLRNIKD
jgi:hypothetical protein